MTAKKTVNVTYKGKKYSIEPTMSLLRDLRSIGINIDSGCLMGMCGTCRVLLKKGVVSYRSKSMFPLKSDERLTCIGKAESDIEIETL